MDYESWMSDFMAGLAKGIEQNKSLVTKAICGMTTNMMINPQTGTMENTTATASTGIADTLSSITSAIKEGLADVTGQSGDVVRTGVVKISVSFSVSPKWLQQLTAYSKLPKLTVQYFDTENLAQKETEMYIIGFKAKLEKDTSYKEL